MDRIERIGPRPTQWQTPPLDPDREDLADRRRREQQRRKRDGTDPSAKPAGPPIDGDPPHHVDVRA